MSLTVSCYPASSLVLLTLEDSDFNLACQAVGRSSVPKIVEYLCETKVPRDLIMHSKDYDRLREWVRNKLNAPRKLHPAISQESGISVSDEEMDFLRASCARKTRYPSMKEAKRTKSRAEEARGVALRVYECHVCGGYHLTSKEAMIA